MEAAPVIEIRDMSFSYGGITLFENVNLAVNRGDFTFIVGKNGSGKSTLMKLILGLLAPDRGSISVLGLPPRKACTRLGYTPQHLEADRKFPASVMDVVLMGRLGMHRKFGPYSHTDKRAAADAIERVGMSRKQNSPFSSLSGGEAQRILIARAIVSEPEILMLDEPTASLDMKAEIELYDVLGKLANELTIMLVSHDFNFVSRYAKNVVCVGRDVHVHPVADITDETLKEIYSDEFMVIRHADKLGGR